MDLERLSSAELVSQYICMMRGSGHFLSPIDQRVVQNWLEKADHQSDRLLLILEGHLGDHYQKGKSRPLTMVEKKISKLIDNLPKA
jgi:hypothetical protein